MADYRMKVLICLPILFVLVDIVAGQFHPFTGPIKDQAGALRVAAGKTLPESELWTMKWYVEGIAGKQPD